MKVCTNRKVNNIEGITNICVSLFGVKFACELKDAIGRIIGARTYKLKKKLLAKWNASCCYPNKELWFKEFDKIIACNNSFSMDFIDCFYNNKLILEKNVEISDDSFIVVCTVKNELIRMRKYVEYYRNICDKVNFLIIDNNSSDGTYEFLHEQDDVRLYSTKEEFRSWKQVAWQNYVMAQCGINRWFLVADCDEFIVYPNIGKQSLNGYVKGLYEEGKYVVKGIMLDMYPQGPLGDNQINPEGFVLKYIYHDDESMYSYDPDRNTVSGGYLERIFNEINAIRTKVPLFYLDCKRFPIGCHNIYPLVEDISSPIDILLLHYKFIPGDLEKIKEYINTKVHANGSRLYKKYAMIFDDNISLYCDSSKRFDGEKTLQEFLDAINSLSKHK